MSVLVINDEVRELIAKVISEAAKDPLDIHHAIQNKAEPHAGVLTFEDRQKMQPRPQKPQHVMIPVDFHCAYSHENQPSGLCRHLSVSIPRKGMLPDFFTFCELCNLFGFHMTPGQVNVWVEEYDPGHFAANAVELMTAVVGERDGKPN